MVKLLDDISYLKYVIFHPFEGFYETKFRGKGSILVATIIFAIYGILQILVYQYTGFITNLNPLFRMNSIMIFITSIFPFILFGISNWTITTLFDGKGNLKDIYIVLGYALTPIIIFSFLGMLLSNIIILEEVIMLQSFQSIGLLWFIFLVFTGLCTIHEYSMKNTILTLLATAIAAIIIIFLAILYFSLMEKVVDFVSTIVKEFIRRW
ncbi:MAG: Yip1 family protein [Cellulosilyticaceae bacterium]